MYKALSLAAAVFLISCALSSPDRATAADGTVSIVVHPEGGAPQPFKAVGPVPMTVEKAMQVAKIKYTATWFPGVEGYAAMIIVGQPKQTTGEFGPKYWLLCVDGKVAQEGMSSQNVGDGNRIDWAFGDSGECPTN